MNRFLTATAALSLVCASGVAVAQDYHDHGDQHGDYHGDQGNNRGPDRGDRGDHGDYHGDNGNYHGDRGDYRGGGYGDHGHHGRYSRGDRYRGDGVYVSDYHRYGYRAPPRGYRYYRTNDGDILLAAIATGVIANVIANDHRHY